MGGFYGRWGTGILGPGDRFPGKKGERAIVLPARPGADWDIDVSGLVTGLRG